MQALGILEHLPQLVASCNAAGTSQYINEEAPHMIRIVTLPKGSEDTLSSNLGIRRASVLAFDIEAPGVENLLFLVENIPFPVFGASFMRSHVKQLKASKC